MIQRMHKNGKLISLSVKKTLNLIYIHIAGSSKIDRRFIEMGLCKTWRHTLINFIFLQNINVCVVRNFFSILFVRNI